MRRHLALALMLSALPAIAPAGDSPIGVVEPDDAPAWRQFGGPGRDFVAPASRIATSWGEEGPPLIWSRELGDGQSAVLFEAGRVYTMYRPLAREGEPRDMEAVVSLDAATGETLWEFRYSAPPPGPQYYGRGPRSTPLIAGGRIFTAGRTGKMHALDTRDGSLLWSRDLWGGEDFGGNQLGHGYSSSPIAWGDTVILPIGAPNASVAAFDQTTGDVRWRLTGFRQSHSSPRIVEIAGREQLLLFMREELIGVDPASGELLWTWPHVNEWGHNITMPSVRGDTIFISSPQAGARGLELFASEDGFEIEQLWASRRIQFYHATTVLDGEWVYGSIGTTAPAFLTAVNIVTGDIGWRQRGFAKANCVEADGHLLILDEDGVLYLADANPESLEVLASTQLLNRHAWTVPTVVGTTLWARDTRRIVAVDLG